MKIKKITSVFVAVLMIITSLLSVCVCAEADGYAGESSQDEVDSLIQAIDGLDLNAITADSKDLLLDLRNKYMELSATQKKAVTNVEKLNEALEIYNEIVFNNGTTTSTDGSYPRTAEEYEIEAETAVFEVEAEEAVKLEEKDVFIISGMEGQRENSATRDSRTIGKGGSEYQPYFYGPQSENNTNTAVIILSVVAVLQAVALVVAVIVIIVLVKKKS